MYKKVSVLIPTRGRTERLRTLISSFDRTTGNAPNAELVFRVDEDDAATYDFLTAWGGHQIVVGPRHNGYASMPLFFNELAKAASGDVLMCGNDDMVFQTPNWPFIILEVANRFPDGLFDFGVSTLNETHFPFSVVSRKVVDKLGFLWDPRIFWGDIFLRDVMAAFDRCVMLPEIRIDHDWAGHAPDQVFIESDKTIGPNYWTEIHATAVQDSVRRLQS